MADTKKLVWDILAVDRASKVFDHISERGEHLGGRMGKVGGMITGAFAGAALLGVGALSAAFGEGLKGAADYQKVTAQTTAVLKSTKDVSQTTALGIQYLSESISEYSGVSRDVVQSGANMLLTFTNIKDVTGKGGDVFDRATKTLVDMTTALGEDPKKAAIQLGKALNDPVKGATALRRVGVTLDAQQQKSIKTFMAHGQIMKAQNVILGELNKEFGGSAKAAGETFAGSLKRLKNSFMDLIQDAITPLLPHLTKFVGFLADKLPGAIKAVIGFLSNLKDRFTATGGAGSGIANVFKKIAGWVRDSLMPALQHLAAVVGPPLQGLFKNLGKGVSNLSPVFKFLGAVLTSIVIPILGQVITLVSKVLGPAFKLIAWILGKVVVPAFKIAIGIILDVLGFVINAAAKAFGWVPGLGGKLKKAAADFNKFAQNVKNSLDGIPDHKQINIIAKANLGFTQIGNSNKRAAADHRAGGGPVRAGSPYLVGENGPELFVPGQSGGIVPNGGSSKSAAMGGGSVYVTIQGDVIGGTADQIAEKLHRLLVQRKRAIGQGLALG